MLRGRHRCSSGNRVVNHHVKCCPRLWASGLACPCPWKPVSPSRLLAWPVSAPGRMVWNHRRRPVRASCLSQAFGAFARSKQLTWRGRAREPLSQALGSGMGWVQRECRTPALAVYETPERRAEMNMHCCAGWTASEEGLEKPEPVCGSSKAGRQDVGGELFGSPPAVHSAWEESLVVAPRSVPRAAAPVTKLPIEGK